MAEMVQQRLHHVSHELGLELRWAWLHQGIGGFPEVVDKRLHGNHKTCWYGKARPQQRPEVGGFTADLIDVGERDGAQREDAAQRGLRLRSLAR